MPTSSEQAGIRLLPPAPLRKSLPAKPRIASSSSVPNKMPSPFVPSRSAMIMLRVLKPPGPPHRPRQRPLMASRSLCDYWKPRPASRLPHSDVRHNATPESFVAVQCSGPALSDTRHPSNAVLLEIHFGADVPHDWRGIIWKNARHRRQVADIAVHDAEEGGDRALIGGNRIEVTRQQFRSCGLP